MAIEFRRRAQSRLKGVTSQFDWLCAMQHFGMPTRLLDWSESLAVALFFSIGKPDREKTQPTIWLLDPFKLAALTDATDVIPIASNENVKANADIAFRDDWAVSKGKVSKFPLPVAPDFLFERLSAQNGTFTIHGSDGRPLEDQLPRAAQGSLIKFIANQDSATDIVNCIRLLRPSADAIFPDLDGMKDYIV